MKRLMTTLDDWLDIATRGLRDNSRERIREEMTAHYEAARVAAMDAKLDCSEAHAAALDALGSPRRARRRFRREHFLAHEAYMYLHERSSAHRKAFIWRVCLTVPVVAVFFTLSLFPGEFSPLTLVLFVGAFGIAYGQFDHLSRGTLRPGRIPRPVWYFAYWVIVFALMSVPATMLAAIVLFDPVEFARGVVDGGPFEREPVLWILAPIGPIGLTIYFIAKTVRLQRLFRYELNWMNTA